MHLSDRVICIISAFFAVIRFIGVQFLHTYDLKLGRLLGQSAVLPMGHAWHFGLQLALWRQPLCDIAEEATSLAIRVKQHLLRCCVEVCHVPKLDRFARIS